MSETLYFLSTICYSQNYLSLKPTQVGWKAVNLSSLISSCLLP